MDEILRLDIPPPLQFPIFYLGRDKVITKRTTALLSLFFIKYRKKFNEQSH
jgi:hypothetical protein